MSRTQQRSRRPLLPESLVRKRDEPDNDGRLKVRRAGVDRRIPNPVVQPAYYYGFLAEIEGEFPGPWFITFECTEWRWFNETLAHFMPGDYDLARLRGVLRGRDYATAWASSIGERLVLRHIYAAYLDAMTSRPPPLADSTAARSARAPRARGPRRTWCRRCFPAAGARIRLP